MGSKTGDQGPTAALAGVGRWIVVTVVGIQLISDTLEVFMTEQVSPVLALIHLTIAVACFVLLWRPWIGLSIGLLPITINLISDDPGSDFVFFLLASAIFVFRYGARTTLPILLAGACYGGLRGFRAVGALGGVTEQMFGYAVLTLSGVFLGLAIRGLHAAIGRREVRLAILAEDIAEIRSGERLRLAGELRTVVGERLEEAWKGQKAPRRTSDAWVLREALERVQTVCLDAVTRVRALVGMLREDPVAEGSDESLSIIGPVQILASMAEALRRQGFHVELRADDRLNHRSVVTQLTVTRVAQLLLSSAENLRPDPLRLKVECPPGETRVMAEIVTPNELSREDISAFERIRERVQALGGRFSRAFTGRGQLLEFRLPESRTGEVDDATPGEEKKSLGDRKSVV